VSSALEKAVQAAAIGGIEAGEPGWTKKIFRFDTGFLGFEGHFPGYPILPAFVQVLTAIVSIEEMVGMPLDIFALDNAKFQKEVRPGSTITVEWQPLDKGPLMFRVRLKNLTETVASFVVDCREKVMPIRIRR
jgi:3-hydroxyacyl-[acyl-carrier-protein] dehydratase